MSRKESYFGWLGLLAETVLALFRWRHWQKLLLVILLAVIVIGLIVRLLTSA